MQISELLRLNQDLNKHAGQLKTVSTPIFSSIASVAKLDNDSGDSVAGKNWILTQEHRLPGIGYSPGNGKTHKQYKDDKQNGSWSKELAFFMRTPSPLADQTLVLKDIGALVKSPFVGVSDTLFVDDKYRVCIRAEGGDLGNFLYDEINQEKLSIDLILNIAMQLLLGYEALHKAGFVHLDPKLKNVVVHLTKNGPLCRIIDFDHSVRYKSRNDQRVAEFFGNVGVHTPEYCAPEYFQTISTSITTLGIKSWMKNNTVNPEKIDCYGLGVILFFCMYAMAPAENIQWDIYKPIPLSCAKLLVERLKQKYQAEFKRIALLGDLVIHLMAEDPRHRYSIQQAKDHAIFGNTQQERENAFTAMQNNFAEYGSYNLNGLPLITPSPGDPINILPWRVRYISAQVGELHNKILQLFYSTGSVQIENLQKQAKTCMTQIQEASAHYAHKNKEETAPRDKQVCAELEKLQTASGNILQYLNAKDTAISLAAMRACNTELNKILEAKEFLKKQTFCETQEPDGIARMRGPANTGLLPRINIAREQLNKTSLTGRSDAIGRLYAKLGAINPNDVNSINGATKSFKEFLLHLEDQRNLLLQFKPIFDNAMSNGANAAQDAVQMHKINNFNHDQCTNWLKQVANVVAKGEITMSRPELTRKLRDIGKSINFKNELSFSTALIGLQNLQAIESDNNRGETTFATSSSMQKN